MTSFSDQLTTALDARLRESDRRLAHSYPGAAVARQPVHTVYVPAGTVSRDTPAQWGAQALTTLDEHGSREYFSSLFAVPEETIDDLLPRVRHKLQHEPVEDLRIDFEDGFGSPSDEIEDAAVARAAGEAIALLKGPGPAPRSLGIRFKSMERPTRARGVRTLVLWVQHLTDALGKADPLLVTLPKVTAVEQVEAMVHACERIEQHYRLGSGRIRFEIQVETPQSILGSDGTALVARMIHAAAGRCSALHYGTYDYSASCGIAAAYQAADHPAADHAKAVMQAAAAGTGVMLSDGSTNVVPAGSTANVRQAWSVHAGLVTRALHRGFYQGWDMHPGHLPTRYLATYTFYRSGFDSAAARLSGYLHSTGGSELQEEPATATALASFLMRGWDCGAFTQEDIDSALGTDENQLAALAGRGQRRP